MLKKENSRKMNFYVAFLGPRQVLTFVVLGVVLLPGPSIILSASRIIGVLRSDCHNLAGILIFARMKFFDVTVESSAVPSVSALLADTLAVPGNDCHWKHIRRDNRGAGFDHGDDRSDLHYTTCDG